MINNRPYVNDYKKIIASFEKLMYNDSEKWFYVRFRHWKGCATDG